jgi:hypothetical protein
MTPEQMRDRIGQLDGDLTLQDRIITEEHRSAAMLYISMGYANDDIADMLDHARTLITNEFNRLTGTETNDVRLRAALRELYRTHIPQMFGHQPIVVAKA